MKGSNHPLAKLTEKQVIKIKELLLTKSKIEIAKKYKVTRGTIYNISNKKTWSHL